VEGISIVALLLFSSQRCYGCLLYQQERSKKMKEDKRLQNIKVEYGEQSYHREYALNIIAIAIATQMINDGVRPDSEKP